MQCKTGSIFSVNHKFHTSHGVLSALPHARQPAQQHRPWTQILDIAEPSKNHLEPANAQIFVCLSCAKALPDQGIVRQRLMDMSKDQDSRDSYKGVRSSVILEEKFTRPTNNVQPLGVGKQSPVKYVCS